MTIRILIRVLKGIVIITIIVREAEVEPEVVQLVAVAKFS